MDSTHLATLPCLQPIMAVLSNGNNELVVIIAKCGTRSGAEVDEAPHGMDGPHIPHRRRSTNWMNALISIPCQGASFYTIITTSRRTQRRLFQIESLESFE